VLLKNRDIGALLLEENYAIEQPKLITAPYPPFTERTGVFY
jgi:hypothetical protein